MASPSADDLQIPSISSSSSSSSSSSLDYINGQLQAHGFARHPLSVAGLGADEREQLAKCLFAMLQQRADDLASLEAVSTAHRTMAYDHERLGKMLKASRDDAGAAERKEQAARSQLAAAQAALRHEQESHRKTREDAAKARTALSFVRTQAQHDLKKRETETARTLERWQRLANDQARQQAARSGLTLVNYVDARGLALLRPLPEPSKFHQAALDELEDARARAVEENDAFRRVLLQLGQHLHAACMALSADPDADGLPDAITPSALFDPAPLTTSARGARTPEQALTPSTTSHASAARATILGLLAQLQAQVRAARTAAAAVAAVAGGKDGREGEDELAKARDAAAQATIRELEDELARLQAQLEERQDFMEDFMKKSSAMYSALDGVRAGVAEDDGAESGDALARQRDALEDDRRRFTEAAVKLGKDRTELEAERLQFLEEKRSLQMAALIADLPPTPDHPSSSSSAASPSGAARADPSSPKSAHLTPARRTYTRKASPLARAALAANANVDGGPASGAGGPSAKLSAADAPGAGRYLAGLVGKENIGTPRKAQLGGTGVRPSLLSGSGAGGGGERRRSRLVGGSPGKPRVARTSLSVRS